MHGEEIGYQGNVAKIHVYGQDAQHEPVFVVGTKEALEALRDAVDRSLSPKLLNQSGHAEAVACDGEGYDIVIIKIDSQTFEQLELPYPLPGLSNKSGTSPWSLVSVTQNPEGNIWRHAR